MTPDDFTIVVRHLPIVKEFDQDEKIDAWLTDNFKKILEKKDL